MSVQVGVAAWGVSAWRGVCPGGYVSGQGVCLSKGVCPGGCLPGGVCPGVCVCPGGVCSEGVWLPKWCTPPFCGQT